MKVNGKTVNAANPYLAEVRNPARVDYHYWATHLATISARQARQAPPARP